MPRSIERLSAVAVSKLAKRKGVFCDGGGLYLHSDPPSQCSWLFRYRVDGKTRWMGLGPYPNAKSNLAPRSVHSPWYRLYGVELPNPEPPVYPHGDNVQPVLRVNLSVPSSAAEMAEDQKIRDSILDLISRGKMIDGRSYPYSPSAAGASTERAVLDDAMAAVRDATAPREWPPEDLKAATVGAIKKMRTEGLLVEKQVSSGASLRVTSGCHPKLPSSDAIG